jgi:hypothetical protein
MMLDDHWFASKQSEHQGGESGASEMNRVRRADFAPQLAKARLAENTKGKRRIVELFGGRFGNKGDFECRRIQFRADPGEASRDGQHDSFGAANARSEIVRV